MKKLVSVITSFAICGYFLFAISPIAKAAVATNGLVLHLDAANSSSYSGSGTAWNDLSGSGNNGTLTNGPTFNTGNGKYIGFDGSNDYVNFGNITSNFSSGFSTSFYANFGATTQSWERVFDFGTAQSYNNILVARAGNTDNLVIELYNSSGSTLGQCSAANAISNNTWAHYAMTLDGTSCKIYKNGNLIATNAYSGLPTNVTRTSNYIGRSNWSSDGYFDVGVGEIAMYTRAITAAEVWQNFKAQSDFCTTSINSSGTTRYISVTSASGCLWTVPSGVTSLGYLVVAGGGGGGGANASALGAGGGGGAGEYLESTTATVTPLTSFVLTVGTGGGGGAVNTRGGSGTASSLIATNFSVNATGGEGGEGSPGISTQSQLSGDGGRYATGGSNTAGLNDWDGGGGGGGAGSAGSNGVDIGGDGGSGGAGGIGRSSSISPTSAYFAAGGGGGGTPSNRTVTAASQADGFGALGGSSIGGNGGVVSSGRTPATAAVANTGSGGGGGGWNGNFTNAQRAGGAGADGVILFKLVKSTGSISSISVTSTSGGDSKYTYGETITVTVYWSETVTITGSPRIPIQGLSGKYLTFQSGTESNSTIFNYVVSNTDVDADGFSISADSLSLNGGTIQDTLGIDMGITHSMIGAILSNAIDGQLLGTVNSLTFSGTVYYRTAVTITANVSIAGNVLFKANGVKIAGCLKRAATGSSPNITATCSWKPSKNSYNTVTATISPSNGLYTSGTASQTVFVYRRVAGR